MILAETFDHSIFRQSLARMFATGPAGLLEQGYNATLEVALPKVGVIHRHVLAQIQRSSWRRTFSLPWHAVCEAPLHSAVGHCKGQDHEW